MVNLMTSTPIQNSETPLQKGIKFLEKKGKLELLAGTIAAKGLAFGQRQQELNQSAEDAFTRRQLWGETSEKRSGEDMSGHTILGDIIVPQSQPQSQPQSNAIGKVLAGAALGASLLGVPGAGVAGYLLSQMNRQKESPAVVAPVPAPVASDSETVDLGLKKIEDLEL